MKVNICSLYVRFVSTRSSPRNDEFTNQQARSSGNSLLFVVVVDSYESTWCEPVMPRDIFDGQVLSILTVTLQK